MDKNYILCKNDCRIELIECLLIPRILYGCEAWINISNKQYGILERLQNDAVIITTPIRNTTLYEGITYGCGLLLKI